MAEERELHSARGIQAVEQQLPQPLLVDPVPAVAPDCDVVRSRQAMVRDLVPAEDREPAVGHELVRQRRDDRAEKERHDRKEKGVL